jgi:predicted ATPase
LEGSGTAPDVAQQRRLAQQYGMAPAVVALAYLAESLWLLGLPEEADQRGREARELAEQIQHPMATCYALGRSCWLAAEKGDVDAVRDLAPRWRQVAQQYGMEVFALAAQFFEHWTAVMQGDPSVDRIEQMQQAMEAYRATGTKINRTAFLVFLAGACGKAGQIERGLTAVEESLSLAEQTGEMWFQAAAWRVKGELLALQARHDAASDVAPGVAACFEMARQVAAQQGCR